MSNIISGAIAVLMCLVFLLYYAYRLGSIALWVIIVGNLVFLVYDYIQSIREGEEHI